MRKLSYIRIALLIICCLFTTPFCFAHLAMDGHIPEELTYTEWIQVGRNTWREFHFTAAMVYVSIDELTFDPSGNGVVNLDGSFYIHNYHPTERCSYKGELRLEILKPQGDGTFLTLAPDAKQEVSGSLKSWNENRDNDEIIDSFSESVSLNIDCLKY